MVVDHISGYVPELGILYETRKMVSIFKEVEAILGLTGIRSVTFVQICLYRLYDDTLEDDIYAFLEDEYPEFYSVKDEDLTRLIYYVVDTLLEVQDEISSLCKTEPYREDELVFFEPNYIRLRNITKTAVMAVKIKRSERC
jgi:hypothetical protein